MQTILKSEKFHPNQEVENRRYSATILAISAFVLVNLIFSYVSLRWKDANKTYAICDNVLKGFRTCRQKPNIVLLGSSLVRKPFFLADSQHTDSIPEYEHYCSNYSLQGLLKADGLNEPVFNFSIDGAMVSDVYLIVDKILKGPDCPKYIVYGTSPRDFTDCLLSKETKTPIFERLYNLHDIWNRDNIFGLSLDERLNLTFDRIVFLFNIRKQVQNGLGNLFVDLGRDPSSTPAKNASHKLTIDEKKLTATDGWQRSIEEYRKRYRFFNNNQLRRQQAFLTRLCSLASRRGAKLLIVNMPLSSDNVSILGKKNYQLYLQRLKAAVRCSNVDFIDSQNDYNFPQCYFADTAHLNENGAHLLNLTICNWLKNIGSRTFNHLALHTAQEQNGGVASWWLAKAYFKGPPADVVILGGSQLGALMGADSYVYNQSVDITGNRRSGTVERELSGLLDKKYKVFVGALPDALISDQYIISRALFSKRFKPKILVLALSPQNFINSHLSSKSTEAFSFFSTFIEKSRIEQAALLEKCPEFGSPDLLHAFMSGPRSPLLLGRQFERLSPGELAINSGDGYIKHDNTKEYQIRYQSPFSEKFSEQLLYFDKLLLYLKSQRIKVVAFDLPLQSSNRKLLPDKFWSLYHQKVAKICKKNDADFIDIQNTVTGFNDEEFFDGVHLNLTGGFRLSSTIALFTANKLNLKSWAELQDCERKMF